MTDADKLKATFQFLRQTGATRVALRSSDNEEPVIWMVVIEYKNGSPDGVMELEVEASLTPLSAALRLCERVADGQTCSYCGRATAFEPVSIGRMPFDQQLCWYQYDPELKVFRRSCE